MTRGIILIAIGQHWVDEAVAASASIRRHMPDIPITVFADRIFACEHVERVIPVAAEAHPLLVRTGLLSQSPYEQTLFLDTDITIFDDITDLFTLLDRFHLAVPHAPYRLANMGLAAPLPEFLAEGVPECFPGMNAGMILYRRTPEVQRFFDDWLAGHERLCALIPGAPAQPAFRSALYRSDLRFAIIPEEYHCRFVFPFKVCGKVKALHGRHPDLEWAIRQINVSPLPRIGKGYLAELGEQGHLTIPFGGVVRLVPEE